MWGFLSPRKHSLITGIYWSTFFKKNPTPVTKSKIKIYFNFKATIRDEK